MSPWALPGVRLDQLALRGLIVTGSLVAVLASGVGGPLPPGWLVGVVGLLALAFAWAPESAAGTVVLIVVLGWWVRAGEGVAELLTGGAILGAAGLLVAHLAGTIAAYGSREVPVDQGVVRVWALRGVLLLLVAPVVWLAAVAVEGQPEPPGVWLFGGGAALVAIVVASSGFDLFQGRRLE